MRRPFQISRRDLIGAGITTPFLLPAPVKALSAGEKELLLGGVLPPPPNGFVYLLGADGAYLLGADGAYLLGVAP